MVITDLISKLQSVLQEHGNLPVEITWESTRHELEDENIYASKYGTIILDGDDNCYKQSFKKR